MTVLIILSRHAHAEGKAGNGRDNVHVLRAKNKTDPNQLKPFPRREFVRTQ